MHDRAVHLIEDFVEDIFARQQCTDRNMTAGQRLGLAVEIGFKVEDLGSLSNPGRDLFLALAGDLQREAHVPRYRHVGIERVALENHRDIAVLGLEVSDVSVADANMAVIDLFKAGEHA